MLGFGAIQAGIGLFGAVNKFFSGKKMERKAQEFIDNFKWKELTNVAKNLSVSTLGAELRAEESARTTATITDKLQQGGVRSLVGGMGRVQAGNNIINREIAANLDAQQKEIDKMVAIDDTKIRAMEEKRQADELLGYGQMLNIGTQTKLGGITDAVNVAGAFGQSMNPLRPKNLNVADAGGLSQGMIQGMGELDITGTLMPS